MKVKLTGKDYAWTASVLFVVFILFPLGLWAISNNNAQKLKRETEAIVPGVIAATNLEVKNAADAFSQEVTSTPIGRNDVRFNAASAMAVSQACDAIKSSVAEQNPRYEMWNWSCIFYLKKFGVYFKEDYGTIEQVSSVPADQAQTAQFDEFLGSNQEWKLTDNERSYWATYKVQANPPVILEFLVYPRVADPQGR